jgi:ethanolamine utilization protein EutQ (cupin superfamily)
LMTQPEGFQKIAPQPTFHIGAAAISRILTDDYGARMRIGLTDFEPGTVESELTYDEALYIIEGEISVESDGVIQSLKPGDLLWMRRGRNLIYRADQPCRFIYVIPADG